MTLCPRPAEELVTTVAPVDAASVLVALLDAMPEQVFVKDVEGRFVRVSRSLVSRLGCTDASEVLGRTDFDFFTAERARKSQQEEREIVQTGEGLLGIEDRHTGPGDRTTWTSTTKLPLFDRDGAVTGIVGIATDVTAKRRATEAFVEQAGELARVQAELDQLAHAVSHDLTAPLHTISTSAELLARRFAGRLDVDANACIAGTIAGVDRMRRLIDDLLAYSRAGRTPQLTRISTEEIVDREIGGLEPKLMAAEARVERGELPIVHGDPALLGQVFHALIENAIKFRGEQPPQIRIAAELSRLGWTFSVSDNGIGIPSEAGDRIFGVFERLDTRGESPGNGIGLSLCRKIVERHGGVIWFDSTPGEGTTFSFVLPAKKKR